MNVQQFISEYGNHIQSYKEYDNGVIMLKFAKREEIMWLKRMVAEKLDVSVKMSGRRTYWFE